MAPSPSMPAIWLEDGKLRLRDDLPVPEPPGGEALVRVVMAGLCSTDLELVRGYYPFTGIPGHEFVGVVERGPAPLMGRRVVGEINASCGRCPACLRGCASHCPDRTVLGIAGRNGAFARWLALPAGNLHIVPDRLSSSHALFAEPLAAALRIREQVDLHRGMRVLVAGDGKLGQLIGQTLALTGCDLTVAGRHEKKLALLAARGIRTIDPGAVEEGAFDLAVECTGNAAGFDLALGALRPQGLLILKSTYASRLGLRADRVVVNEIRLLGSRCGPFEPALGLLAEGAVDVAPLIHGRYPLEEGLRAFDHARRPGVLKVVLEMEG